MVPLNQTPTPPRRRARPMLHLLALALLLASPPARAKKSKKEAGGTAETAGQTAKDGLKSRDELLRDSEAVTGLLTFHRSSEKLYLEIRRSLLGVPLGFSAVQVRSTGDFRPRGSSLETQLVTWEQVGDHLVLYKENLDFRADEGSPYHRTVRETFPRSPIWSARLERLKDDPAPLLVEASELFGPDLTEIVPTSLGAQVVAQGTLLESLKAFADNPDRVLSRDRLLDLAHHRDRDPFDRSIDIRVARLRRKVEADPANPRHVVTVRGLGYRLQT